MDGLDWCWVVNWGWFISWFVSWGRWISSLAFIRHISNISTISIIDMIVYNLGAAIGKGNAI